MPSDKQQNQEQQDQQASELEIKQLDEVVGGRMPLRGGSRKGGGDNSDPCDGGE